jgi:hypothetical protein
MDPEFEKKALEGMEGHFEQERIKSLARTKPLNKAEVANLPTIGNPLDKMSVLAETVFERKMIILLRAILQKQYSDEFELIDGRYQHPAGANFTDWLNENYTI